VTYLLTSGGHNAGIVSEPGHLGRSFRVGVKKADQHLSRSRTLSGAGAAQRVEILVAGMGGWLEQHSGSPAAVPPMGLSGSPPLANAPGEYVLMQ
jgi:polyhydroxyalkanoate synthase subunit PhaC